MFYALTKISHTVELRCMDTFHVTSQQLDKLETCAILHCEADKVRYKIAISIIGLEHLYSNYFAPKGELT